MKEGRLVGPQIRGIMNETTFDKLTGVDVAA